VQRPSHLVAAIEIVDHPCPIGARRPSHEECPCFPASTRLGWSQRENVEKVEPPRVGECERLLKPT
jgi:hypothetical protein